jgi:hypothetical protein
MSYAQEVKQVPQVSVTGEAEIKVVPGSGYYKSDRRNKREHCYRRKKRK